MTQAKRNKAHGHNGDHLFKRSKGYRQNIMSKEDQVLSSEILMLRFLSGASWAGLTFQIFESCITLADEVHYIWNQKSSFNRIKLIYLLLRYFGLVAQIINTRISSKLYQEYPLGDLTCWKWYIYQTIVTQVMLGLVEIILMVRVYAFYGRNRTIGWFLISVFFAQFSLVAASAKICFQTAFTKACLMKVTPFSLSFYGFTSFAVQAVILGLNIHKNITGIQSGWGEVPLVSLLMRDSIIAFMLIIGILSVTIVYCFCRDLMAHVVFPAIVAILSSAGCRIIINIQRLGDPDVVANFDEHSESPVQLTTVFPVDLSTDTGTLHRPSLDDDCPSEVTL